MNNISNFRKFLPILLVEFFLSIGYILYRFGPWTFPYKNDMLTLFFISSCQLMLFVGYFLTIRPNNQVGIFVKLEPHKVISFLCIINTILYSPYCYYRTGYWFPPIFSAITDLAAAYSHTVDVIVEHSGNFVMHILLGSAYIFIYSLFPLLYYYWDQLNTKIKIWGSMIFFGYLFIEICTGKNYGITICALISIVILITKYASGKYDGNKIALTKSLLFTFLLCSFAGFFFYTSMSDRSEYANAAQEVFGKAEHKIDPKYSYKPAEIVDDSTEEGASIQIGKIRRESLIAYEQITKDMQPFYKDEFTLSYVDTSDIIFRNLPERAQFFYAIGSYYISHGYHGLTLALRLPFDWCYGVGHLAGVRYYLEKFEIDLYNRTYEYKLNSVGYPVGLKWMTAYPQFASDFTFPGTILIMGLLGYLLAQLWQESLIGKNPISIVLLTNLAIQFIFITSWWQAGLTGSAFITFYGLLFLWILLSLFKRSYIKNTNSLREK